MTTTPPTAADVDAWFLTYEAFNLISWQDPGPTSFWAVGYTQNDSTQQFVHLPGNPAAAGYQSAQAVFLLQGLIAAYGSVTVREYQWTLPTVIDTFLASGTEETLVNDPVNWSAAP